MNNTAKNAMLDHLGTLATKVGLYNGSTEINGGSYARQSVTWDSASNGSMSASDSIQFSVPAGASISHIKLFSSDGNTEYADFLVSTEVYTNAGTYTVTTLTLDLNK